MYDEVIAEGRGDQGLGQVKLWQNLLHEYHLGNKVPAVHGKTTYSVAMREGGFLNIVKRVLVSWTDEAEQDPVYDKWGGIFTTSPDYLFGAPVIQGTTWSQTDWSADYAAQPMRTCPHCGKEYVDNPLVTRNEEGCTQCCPS